MNLILIDGEKDYFTSPTRVKLHGRRFEHIKKVHRACLGDSLAAGIINGRMGTGTITDISTDHLEMELILNHDPPPALEVTLVMALPRPKMLRRILEALASLGVKQIYLINSWRVEKGFWSTPVLEQTSIDKALLLGLEQAGDTVMPRVSLRRFFTPFVNEELDTIAGSTLRLAAHPKGLTACPCHPGTGVTLAMGPEGGFIQKEIDSFERLGFTCVTLGPRILRLETAVPYLISRLFA